MFCKVASVLVLLKHKENSKAKARVEKNTIVLERAYIQNM